MLVPSLPELSVSWPVVSSECFRPLDVLHPLILFTHSYISLRAVLSQLATLGKALRINALSALSLALWFSLPYTVTHTDT